jgi:hypothetical protein
MMNDLHAAILTITICNHSPYAFYDVVALHESHPHFAMAPSHSIQESHSHLEHFFKSASGFTTYYKAKKPSHVSNQQTFLWSLISTLDSLCLSQEIEAIRSFLNPEEHPLLKFDSKLLISWFKLSRLIQVLLLQSIYEAIVVKKTLNSGRIRAAALQLMNLRVSPRSAFTKSNGTFQPLVNTDVTTLDVANTKAMVDFFTQKASAQRALLLEEILKLAQVYRSTLLSTHSTDNRLETQNNAAQVLQAVDAIQISSKKIIPKTMRANPNQRYRLFYRHTVQERLKKSLTLHNRQETSAEFSTHSKRPSHNSELN